MSNPGDRFAQSPRLLRLRFEPPPGPAALGQAWRDHLAPVFACSFRPETDLTIPISMVSYHLGDLLVGDVVAPAHTLERSRLMVQQQGLDHVLVQFYRSGRSRVETGQRQGEVLATQFVVFDLAQPVRITAEAVAATNLLLPRALLESRGCAVATLHGCAFDHDGDPVARMLYAFLTNLVSCGDLLEPEHASSLTRALAELCGTCLRGRASLENAESVETGLAVRQFIQQALASRDLTPRQVAARFGLSRSALYRLFEADGGVLSYIRDRRLMRAMRILTEAGPTEPVRVSTVAYAVGFSDEGTFRRAFKRRFGFIPSETAPHHAGWSGNPGGMSVLLDWIANL